MVKDYYKILNIKPTAEQNEIKKAYRKAAMFWHPDKNNSPNARQKFIELNEAYEMLISIEKRDLYDEYYKMYFMDVNPKFEGKQFSSKQEEILETWIREIRIKWDSKKTFKAVDDSFVNFFHLIDEYRIILLILFILLILYLKNN